jgi:hypothetical protein
MDQVEDVDKSDSDNICGKERSVGREREKSEKGETHSSTVRGTSCTTTRKHQTWREEKEKGKAEARGGRERKAEEKQGDSLVQRQPLLLKSRVVSMAQR